MKKKLYVIIIFILLIILFSPVKDFLGTLIMPEKILVIGDKINENEIKFFKEIKNKKKINTFESLFEEVNFVEEWNGEKNNSDVVTYIRHTKEGTFTHWFEIWFNEDEGIDRKSVV